MINRKKKILLTGGCGKIGSYFASQFAHQYDFRIVDRRPWDPSLYGNIPHEFIHDDLLTLEDCRRVCKGMDVVVHLAADASPEADFMESLLDNNIRATYNIFEAAALEGCSRFIYASSVHAVASHPAEVQIHTDMPVRPTSMYGVTKCFGEAMAAHYACNMGLPSIAIRIGAYLHPDELDLLEPYARDAYLHPDDFNHLLVQCIEIPDVPFLIAAGISDNRYKRLDLTETRSVLHYQPKADIFTMLGLLPE